MTTACESNQNRSTAKLTAACSRVRNAWSPREKEQRALLAAAAQRRLMSLLLMRDADELLQVAAANGC